MGSKGLAPASRGVGHRTEAELNLPVGHTLEEIEKIYIVKTLEQTVGNRTRVSEILGIAVRTLLYKLKKYGLEGHLLKAD